ncbi:methyltransferase domain-containing protein [Candidatus Bathyarchaeota archaeon]|nr:methyltransferase domain-containing protein [Candidatus Bathyarchaeota archaeon]
MTENAVSNFYEKEGMVESLVDSDRSRKAIKILKDIIANISDRDIKFLEIGCGTGEFLERIASLDERLKVWGVDISKLAISKVKQKGFEGFALDISRQKTPFPDNFFDIIYAGDVVEHLFDPDFMIKEAKRVLKDGGLIILSTPNLSSYYNRVMLLFGFQPFFSEVSTEKVFGRPGEKIVGHIRLYTLKSLKEFLSYYGLEIVKVEGVCFHAFGSLLRLADKFFSHFPSLSSIIIVIARNKQK